MAIIGSDDAARISQGAHSDPFSVLGLHHIDGVWTVNCFHPEATSVSAIDAKTGRRIAELAPVDGAPGVFSGQAKRRKNPFAYRLKMSNDDAEWVMEDAYRFGPVLGELDEHLISEGAHLNLWKVLGAHVMTHEGQAGTHFAVWAPNASRVAVTGDFSGWDGRRYPMRKRGQTGVWEIFVPAIGDGASYKFELHDAHGNLLPEKADPFGFGAEYRPATASVVRDLDGYDWSDKWWMSKREAVHKTDKPVSVYEVHLGSWKLVPEDGDRQLTYIEYATQLVDYVKYMGFTHIELMPVSEFPFDGSWGYQPIGLFAPTSRHGTPEQFRDFIAACHNADLGVILDWVPGHFPEDAHGLGKFDGSHLYEHADRREGFHPDWNTLVFNYGRREVSNYLVSNALFWLQEYHIDGLRVDAVASMLYRDYSRKDGEWVPNIHGGRENLEAISFMQSVNATAYGQVDGIMTIAEESTAFPGVTGMTDNGGLGFGFKWNMGWMNDTLSYMEQDPIHRKYHHSKMTFGIHYAFTENFILPISHDEVVHGKGSMIDKMPGQGDDKFANLRAYYGFMWGHPGKKLLFMGCEFAQGREWNHDASLDWHLLDTPQHKGVQTLVKDLNAVYRTTPALHELDCKAEGFQWVEENAGEESLFAWVRHGADGSAPVLVVCNFTPVTRLARRIGVPAGGHWKEILNTDAAVYGGTGAGNLGGVDSAEIASSGFANSVELTIPPLSTLIFELEQN